jgi:hypothetical protein
MHNARALSLSQPLTLACTSRNALAVSAPLGPPAAQLVSARLGWAWSAPPSERSVADLPLLPSSTRGPSALAPADEVDSGDRARRLPSSFASAPPSSSSASLLNLASQSSHTNFRRGGGVLGPPRSAAPPKLPGAGGRARAGGDARRGAAGRCAKEERVSASTSSRYAMRLDNSSVDSRAGAAIVHSRVSSSTLM